MPLTRPTMFGASVVSIRNKIGWNQSGSILTLTLVEDHSNGDSCTLSSSLVGLPAKFTLGAFVFQGLLRKFTKTVDRNGNPLWEAELIDPRQLLDNAKIILSEYNRTTTGIFNLFNIYGYLENTGYGNSQVNDTGMPYGLIKSTLLTLCNGSPGSFGGPISYRGQTYHLDLSQLPTLPSYFRIGGNSYGLSILDFIQIVCDAACYDFFVQLTDSPYTIVLKTVSRVNAYPLGTIGTMLATTFAGQVVRSGDGIETREETTSMFLVGGDVHTLYEVDPPDTFPFWGFDNNGVINFGHTGSGYANFYGYNVNGSGNYKFYSTPVYEYALYVPEISSITGSTTYSTNDLELQVLLGIGNSKDTFASWERYFEISNPTLFSIVSLGNPSFNIQPPLGIPADPNNIVRSDTPAITQIQAANRNNIATTGQMRLRLVYEALVKYARDYYGKKYACELKPNAGSPVLQKADSETGAITLSHAISDGGWVDALDTNSLLGLPSYGYDLFQTQDGRFIGYGRYSTINADISRINPTNTLIDPVASFLYSKARINNDIYFYYDNTSYAVVEIDPVYNYPDSIVGLSGIVGALAIATGIYIENAPVTIQNDGQRALDALQRNHPKGSFVYVVHPAPRQPTGIEIPLKSNILTYGPWYAQGATGKIVYEQDSSLVPWNYNGYSGLNVAGNAKVLNGISQINIIETGYVEVEDEPVYNIGDIIQANGPNITDIQIGIDSKVGLTTTYRFETYVPRFGTIGKYNVDMMRRMSIASQKIITETRARNRLLSLSAVAEAEAARTTSLFPLMYEAINIRSPLSAVVSTVIKSTGIVDGNYIYPTVSATTYKESMGFIPPSGADYKNFALGTLDQIIAPYSIGYTGIDTYMPNYRQPPASGLFSPSGNALPIITSSLLNPWAEQWYANDKTYLPSGGWTARVYTRGSGIYEQMNDDFNLNQLKSHNVKRVFGLKGPLVLTGCDPTFGSLLIEYIDPGSGTVKTDTIPSNLQDYSTWLTGPIDLLWDSFRKTWTPHTTFAGQLIDDVPGFGYSGTWYIQPPLTPGGADGTQQFPITGRVALQTYDAEGNLRDLDTVLYAANFGNEYLRAGKYVNISYNAHLNQFCIQNNDYIYDMAQIVQSGIYNIQTSHSGIDLSITYSSLPRYNDDRIPIFINVPYADIDISGGLVTAQEQYFGGHKHFTSHARDNYGSITLGNGAPMSTIFSDNFDYPPYVWNLDEVVDIAPNIHIVSSGTIAGLGILYTVNLSQTKPVDTVVASVPDRVNPALGGFGAVYCSGTSLDYSLCLGVWTFPGQIFRPNTLNYAGSVPDFTNWQTLYGVKVAGGLVVAGASGSIPIDAMPAGSEISMILDASLIPYTAAASGDWAGSIPPTNVAAALDRLAAHNPGA